MISKSGFLRKKIIKKLLHRPSIKMEKGIFKKSILFLLFLLFTIICFGQCSEEYIINLRKTAIIFGEKEYSFAPSLANPVNDAKDIADSLSKLGFDVFPYYNSNYRTMESTIDDWCLKLKNYDVALFYFSGHGAEVNGENFLLPVDANPKGPSDLHYEAYSASKLIERFDSGGSRLNIIILDACRNNPFTRNWSRGAETRGLVSMSGKGAFIGYAASPGTVASDGEGRNGTYTSAILKNITLPDLTIDEIFTRVNSDVRRSSSGQQIPFKNSSLGINFCFSIKHSAERNPKIETNDFNQPASAMLLSENENLLYIADSAHNKLIIKDAESNNVLSFIPTDKLNPCKVAKAKGGDIYFIDNRKSVLFKIDTKENRIKDKILLPFTPKSIAIGSDGQKAFLTFDKDTISSGGIGIIDLNRGVLIKSTFKTNNPKGIVISPDRKNIYIITNGSSGYDTLFVIDYKTEKIIKYIKGLNFGNEIGISPDNKKIYLSGSANNKAADSIFVLDSKTYNIKKSVPIKANSFVFTQDSKYLFALNQSNIVLIETDNDSVINFFPFATPPSSLSVTTDYRVFVWLPEESRTQVFVKKELFESKLVYDPESALRKFKNDFNNDPSETKYIIAQELFAEFHDSLTNTVINLMFDLGKSFEPVGQEYNLDFKTFTYTYRYGLRLVYNPEKIVLPYIKCIILNGEFVATIQQSENDKEMFRVPAKKGGLTGIKEFIKNYFIKHLNQLK